MTLETKTDSHQDAIKEVCVGWKSSVDKTLEEMRLAQLGTTNDMTKLRIATAIGKVQISIVAAIGSMFGGAVVGIVVFWLTKAIR